MIFDVFERMMGILSIFATVGFETIQGNMYISMNF